MSQLFLAIASILGGVAVGAGAFASHALKGSLSDVASATLRERSLEIFETGTRYQMYHALALLLVALLLEQEKFSPKFVGASGYAFILGIVIFSGSLYALSLTNMALRCLACAHH
jgi:uncharacterized membrane protein YgdD (TMEM256/DUF423 family)